MIFCGIVREGGWNGLSGSVAHTISDLIFVCEVLFLYGEERTLANCAVDVTIAVSYADSTTPSGE